MNEDIFDVFWVAETWVINRAGGITINENGLPVLTDECTVVTATGFDLDDPTSKKKGILVLTDRDLAERFVAGMPKPGLAVAAFPSKEHFGAFLQRARQRGETHVAYDPSGGKVRMVSIERVLASLAGKPS